MPTDPLPRKNTYVLDSESGTEMVRIILQDRMVTKCMGGAISEREDDEIAALHDILDIACGPGAWVLDVAFAYPEIQVTGIDISRTMIEYACANAQVQGLYNASFKVMDALQPLEFADNSFDLVNSRVMFAFMSPADWPKLVQECMRILRPGGTLRMTEIEYGISNSPATEKLSGMFTQALQRAGRSFSPDDRHPGITPMLEYFLRKAGFEHIQKRPYVLDASMGSEAYSSNYQNIMTVHKMLQPFLVSQGLITDEEFEPLYQQSLAEMQLEDFRSLWYFLTVWGQKPL